MALSLVDLDAHDDHPQVRGAERRYLCPEPACADKPQDRAHQCFTVNTTTGAYHCQRCGAKGKLREFWSEPERPLSRRAQGQAQLRKAFALTPERTSTTATIDHAERLGVPIVDAPDGLAYLERRGIPVTLATAAGVRYSPAWGASEKWQGVPAVVFPMRNQDGTYVAAHGRYIAGNLKSRTTGPTALALFETAGALESDAFAITEAPIDALSLAALGLPAVAMVGTNPQAWIRRHVYERRVIVATDADNAGDGAAASLVSQLGSFGAYMERLRPPAPCKDWNEALAVFSSTTLSRFVQSYRAALDPIEDPRGELTQDTALWVRLLSRAYAIDGTEYSGIFGALLGLRCSGAQLEPTAAGVRLVPGEIDADEYAQHRTDYLAPNAEIVRLLLGSV